MSDENTALEVMRQLSPAEVNWKTAQKIANTPFVPSEFRGKAESVFAAILYGAELGLGPMQALNGIHIIEGRPSMSPELMRALVAKAGHRIDVLEASNEKVVLWGKRCDNSSESTVTWTMKDAIQAGLGLRGAWKTYPRAMLLARATSELCRMTFADCVAGLSYTPEENASVAGVDWSPPEVATSPIAVEPKNIISSKGHNVNENDYKIEETFAIRNEEIDIVDAEIIQDEPREPYSLDKATIKQASMINKLLKEWGLTNDEGCGLAEMVMGVRIKSLAIINKKQASSFIDYLMAKHPNKRTG